MDEISEVVYKGMEAGHIEPVWDEERQDFVFRLTPEGIRYAEEEFGFEDEGPKSE